MPSFPALTDILLFIGLIVAFVTIRLLIPKREDILVGRVRFKMESPLVPILVSLVTVIGIVVLSLSFLEPTLPIGSVVGAALLLIGSGLIWLEFTKVKKLNQMTPEVALGLGGAPLQQNLPPGYVPVVHEVHHVKAVVPVQQPGVLPAPPPQTLPQAPPQSLPQAPYQPSQALSPPHSIKVECPQCGAHIDIPPGSNQITCPHCGLSGTM